MRPGVQTLIEKVKDGSHGLLPGLKGVSRTESEQIRGIPGSRGQEGVGK
ncbi:MAG: hypothetical protein RJR37_09790 [Peptococcaceae bacterium MAG4]|nr:hypothetical protein [Peptococcaceae bacterium MAG4]